MQYDVFISHASEDKDSFVRQLAIELEAQHIKVWYDEFALKPGESLRRSIDYGLAHSRLGIVVLSENFFKKKWTNWELNGLVARQNASENDPIIPIWLDIDRAQLLAYSPSLADKVAISASIGINQVVKRLLPLLKPNKQTHVSLEISNFFELIDLAVGYIKTTRGKEDKWISEEEAMLLLQSPDKDTLRQLCDRGLVRCSQASNRFVLYDRESILKIGKA